MKMSMKQLHEITNFAELEEHRKYLLQLMHHQEKAVNRDIQKINNNWSLLYNIGSSVGNLAMAFMPRLNKFTLLFTLLRKILRRKK